MKKEHVAPRELMALPQLINAVFGAFCLTAQLIADPAESLWGGLGMLVCHKANRW